MGWPKASRMALAQKWGALQEKGLFSRPRRQGASLGTAAGRRIGLPRTGRRLSGLRGGQALPGRFLCALAITFSDAAVPSPLAPSHTLQIACSKRSIMLRIGTDFACSLFLKIFVWVPRLELGGPPKGRIRDGEDVGWCPAKTWAGARRDSRWVGQRRPGWLWRRREGSLRKRAVFSAAQRRGKPWDG